MDRSMPDSAVLHYLPVVVVQSLSHVQLFATPWTAALQASLSFTISGSWLRFMFNEWVMLYIHLILMSLSKLWEIVKDREAWSATVHRVANYRT